MNDKTTNENIDITKNLLDPSTEEHSESKGKLVIEAISSIIANQLSDALGRKNETDETENVPEELLTDSQLEGVNEVASQVKSKLELVNPFSGPCPVPGFKDDFSQQILNQQWEYSKTTWHHNSSLHMTQDMGIEKMLFDMCIVIASNMSLKHFVGIQPMSGPVSLVYVLRPTESNTNEIISKAVEAGTRKLTATWTIEAMEDIKAMHGVDILGDLIRMLAVEISYEHYTEVIRDVSTTKSRIVENCTAGDEIADMLYMESRLMEKRNGLGIGNKIIASNAIVSELLKLGGLEVVDDVSKRYDFVSYVGEMAGISVFCDPMMKKNEALMCRKGDSGQTDAGYFFCPYITLMSSGVVVNPTTFQPLISLMTRYGKSSSRNEIDNFYSHFTFGDIDYKPSDDRKLAGLFKDKTISSALSNYTDCIEETKDESDIGESLVDALDVVSTIVEELGS